MKPMTMRERMLAVIQGHEHDQGFLKVRKG
jgi:hypothetical protein